MSQATIGTGILIQLGLGDGVASAASHRLGSGTNGVVTTVTDVTGLAGNLYKINVRKATVVSASLSAAISGTTITVTLGTGVGVLTLDPAKNTATLVAGAIAALTGVTATASGSGATAITELVEGEQFSGGTTDGSGETFRTLAELVSVKPPPFSRNEIDVSNHNAGIEEKLLGMLRLGQCAGKANWIPSDLSQDSDIGVLSDIKANRKRNWRIAFPPAGVPNWTFPARVQKWELQDITTDAAEQFDFALTLDGNVVMVDA